ncbi:cytosolic cu zn superoxide dismutase [Sporothrix schenckii 1099-18]|uniref:superoxide dismutase n=2 Tax=Sporothrix schenckii TaxID=29908 RepID=U7PTB1_SPOS1|nr:cytosolic cu zn superoxide dismutase [Sporothrix schenckii 1099-18]ERS97959.1 hypothetical protein HMPREF1624_06131 [Sporothrix schenckii ATCC 58251]KJR82542.1 cytosolic cu zn superoxide dismutase [Sporothrix schenckii 1099-18]
MRVSTLLVASAASVMAQDASGPHTGSRGNATVTNNNPSNVTYIATLPSSAFAAGAFPDGGNFVGSVSAEAGPGGVGVTYHVNISHLPSTGGPFMYHVHTHPVPPNGNCSGTLGHLDPFDRKDQPPCDPNLKETCQVGDLSGKYGNISLDPYTATYHDLYSSLDSSSESFIGNRSIVLHFANTTRITCANFTVAEATLTPANRTTPAPTGTRTGSGAGSPSNEPSSRVTVSAASGHSAGAAALGVGALGVLAAIVLAL